MEILKAKDIINYLLSLSTKERAATIDTIKAGNEDKEVKKIAFCFIATPTVIANAVEWGADMLVTHEPTYHDHFDNMSDNDIENEKKNLVEKSGMTFFRFHDHAHDAMPDIIHDGFCKTLGFNIDDIKSGKIYVTPYELAKLIEEKCGIKHVRICGNRYFRTNKIGLYLGACGDVSYKVLREGTYDIVICGEVCEWQTCEFVRDSSELGKKTALLALGHVGSERDGMKYLADKVQKDLDVATKYFECGEVYTYTED